MLFVVILQLTTIFFVIILNCVEAVAQSTYYRKLKIMERNQLWMPVFTTHPFNALYTLYHLWQMTEQLIMADMIVTQLEGVFIVATAAKGCLMLPIKKRKYNV